MPETMPSAASEDPRSHPPMPAPLRPFRFPEAVRAELPNGLRTVTVSTRAFPVVTLELVLPAGAASDPVERVGLASLTAELLRSGAGARDAAQIAEVLEGAGAEAESSASWDGTYVGVTALRERLPDVLSVLGDLVQRPTFPADETERVRYKRLGDLLRRRSDPRALAAELTARFVYAPGATYAHSPGGTRESLSNVGRGDVASFHGECFTPAGATLVLVGDLSPAEAHQLASDLFGGWEPSPAPVVAEPDTRAGTPGVVLVHRPGSQQAELRVAHVGVARCTGDYFPLVLLNTALGGAFSSRLNLNLRERHGFTYGASSGWAMRRGAGPFVVSAAVQTEVAVAAVREILYEVSRTRDDGITAEELDAAQRYVAGIFPLTLQTTGDVAGRLAEAATYALPDDYFATYRERVAEVTVEAVRAAGERHLRPDEFVIVAVGDAAELHGSLEELGRGAVRVVDVWGAELDPGHLGGS